MIILVAVPEGTANRQIIGISYNATQTRKSLVKGERFIRAVWMAEMMIQKCYSSKISVYILKWVGLSALDYNGLKIEKEKYFFFGFSTKKKKTQ